MVCTTSPKEDKVDTSSAGVPTAQALVVRPGSKTPGDNLIEDDLDLLKFDMAEPEIICRKSSWL
jgi:hypothetical protein